MQSQNFMIVDDPLCLDRIRNILIRLEDTIIFSLIERAQFAHNPRIYQRGAFQEIRSLGFEGSWMEWFLREIESFHAKARRYSSPDETPFSRDLPEPVLPPLPFPNILYPNNINANPSILSFYTRYFVPRLTRRATLALARKKRANGIMGDEEFEDDGNYGSAATIDVEILQYISKRVHYGKFVSESKFQADPAAFIPHILNPNRTALEALITKPEVERKLLQRLHRKACTYAQDLTTEVEILTSSSPIDSPSTSSLLSTGPPLPHLSKDRKLDVDGVVELYEEYIIPLTKEVEVDYLLRRLDGLSKDEIDTLAARKKAH
ncbi:chorismate mutase [Pterulicium gracile]|uniref:Chorismate mutase n=1 Tax=Pterulicium gracile TaxID=1884261 RepID=A0A5C3QPZ8_9AGAR|nr:chorismate mutase [Pterula gracilis]